HLLFAETSGLQENTRNVSFSINGGPVSNLDVVDDAAGDDAATTKVFPGIQPADDGTIHLDFTSPQSFVNAIEIVPGVADSIQPVRIVAGHSLFRDSRGNVWLPDKYAFGGRLSRFSGDVSKFADGGLYEWQRMGHFHYVIPVAAGRTYTVRMYFHEPWFGSQNGNVGGVGSRVFDVSCNGSALLRNFDILHEAGPAPLVRSFAHVQPTAQGKIEIYFTPVVNYPAVSAVEVIPE
ncbi:MAG: malectin domain-containing carbohydrate-binding protein, partial [Terriglobales bacterium]